MNNYPKIIIVMPAYNAEKTLARTVVDIPQRSYDEIIMVDDASRDQTVAVAHKLGLKVIQHKKNKGYGANQKTCYREALKDGAEIVVMVHPDYQYDARVVPAMVSFIENDICDVVLGSRIRTRREVLGGGMPLYKYFFNRCLTFIENIVLGLNLSEYHSGLRAYKREVLATIPFAENSDGFSFDSEFLIQAAYFNFRVGEVPVPVRYFQEASSIDFFQSVAYGVKTVFTLLKYILHKLGLIESGLFKSKAIYKT